MKLNQKALLTLLFALTCTFAFAHSGETHVESSVVKNEKAYAQAKAYTQAKMEYDKRIKPIFQEKCYDCHGSGNKLPWYANWPLISRLIQSDIKNAKEHIDMTKGFPFAGHGTNLGDLEALLKSVEKGDMPPLRYRIMHWDTDLTEEEVRVVKHWIGRTYHYNLSDFGRSKRIP